MTRRLFAAGLSAASMLLTTLAAPARALALPPSTAPLPTRVVVRDSGTGQRLRLAAAAAPPRPAAPAPRDPPRPVVSRSLALRQGSGQIVRLTAPAASTCKFTVGICINAVVTKHPVTGSPVPPAAVEHATERPPDAKAVSAGRTMGLGKLRLSPDVAGTSN